MSNQENNLKNAIIILTSASILIGLPSPISGSGGQSFVPKSPCKLKQYTRCDKLNSYSCWKCRSLDVLTVDDVKSEVRSAWLYIVACFLRNFRCEIYPAVRITREAMLQLQTQKESDWNTLEVDESRDWGRRVTGDKMPQEFLNSENEKTNN